MFVPWMCPVSGLVNQLRDQRSAARVSKRNSPPRPSQHRQVATNSSSGVLKTHARRTVLVMSKKSFILQTTSMLGWKMLNYNRTTQKGDSRRRSSYASKTRKSCRLPLPLQRLLSEESMHSHECTIPNAATNADPDVTNLTEGIRRL